MAEPEGRSDPGNSGPTDRHPSHPSPIGRLQNWELLIASLLLVLVYVLRHTGFLFETAVNTVNLALMAIAMFLVMDRAGSSARTRTIQGVAAAITVGLSLLGLVLENQTITIMANLMGAYIIGFTVILLFQLTLRRQRVTGDTLFGAISIYLSIGIVFGIVYTAIARTDAAAFDPAQVIADGRSELYYFSFVSLTTLGYGDISPVADLPQILATLEAILGVVLLATLIGRIVALMVAQETSDRRSD